MNMPDQAAQIARAQERADAAQRDISRVEESLGDRIGTLETAVTEGFKATNEALSLLTQEISELKVENAKRTGAERAFKWMFSVLLAIALTLAGIVYHGHVAEPRVH
jgi:hypothetical protein